MADSTVHLGAGSPEFSGMTMDEAMFGTSDPVAISRATRPSFDESGLGYYFQDGEMVPAADEEGYRIEMPDDLDPEAMEFEQSVGRASPYEGLAEPLTTQSTPDFTSRPTDLRGFKGASELYISDQRFPGPVYEEGQPPPGSETAYMSPGYQQDTFGAMPMDIYEMPGTTLAEPTTSYDNPARALRVMQGRTRDGDTELERQRLFNRRVRRQLRENMAAGMENPLENVFGFAGPQIAMQEGGAVEEMGIMSALFNPLDDYSSPGSAEQSLVRESGREGSEGAATFYAEGAPTFEQVLEERYGYPDVPRGDFYNTTEAMRAERPRHDMPTYQEMEDARAHALMTATLAQDVGPETALKMGGLSEFFDRNMPFLGTATDADVAMDTRNNAFGIQLLNKAGINASPQEIAATVDQAIFDQLDRILDREPGERSFTSPKGGIDVYFPRDRYGYFDINRYQTRD